MKKSWFLFVVILVKYCFNNKIEINVSFYCMIKNIMEVNMKTEEEYYECLNDMEKLVFNIAKEHLGTSFHVKKSNGYANGGGIKEEPIIVKKEEPVMVKKKIKVKKIIL
tara:strand:+ start:383 stop:709 length:327 start_codon:yes stop_codon:yes gene_type:complete